MRMELDKAIKKFTKPDGTVELPADLLIEAPKRTSIKNRFGSQITKPGDGFVGDFQMKDGKIFVDGKEVDEVPHGIVINKPNRAQRRAKKK